jgi:hypothetical protein
MCIGGSLENDPMKPLVRVKVDQSGIVEGGAG